MGDPSSDHQADVTRFFDGYAQDFHGIYGRQNAATLGALIDRVTRKGMLRRFEETVHQCKEVNATSLLDVGCGPGIHDVILADKLSMKIRGLDIAPNMIEIARKNAEQRGVTDLCDYSVMDFMEFEGGRDFDMSLSLGVVEYIEEPSAFIKKMIGHSKKRVLFSLPVKWHLLTPQRMVRYKLRNCPLRFYDKDDIARLMKLTGVSKYHVKRLNRDYLVIIETE